MCFRPPDASGGLECPNCGKKINSTNGVLPKKCPFCKTSFEGFGEAPAPKAPSAPGAPKAPSVPGMPAAPTVPGAPVAKPKPKIPGMPS